MEIKRITRIISTMAVVMCLKVSIYQHTSKKFDIFSTQNMKSKKKEKICSKKYFLKNDSYYEFDGSAHRIDALLIVIISELMGESIRNKFVDWLDSVQSDGW